MRCFSTWTSPNWTPDALYIREKINLFSVTGRDASLSGVAHGSEVAAAGVLQIVHHELADGSASERPQGVSPLLQVGPRLGVEQEQVAQHRRPVLVLDHIGNQLRSWMAKQTKINTMGIRAPEQRGMIFFCTNVEEKKNREPVLTW